MRAIASSWIVGPIKCEFSSSGDPDELPDVWLMLHESAERPGVLVGGVRLGGNRHAFASRETTLSVPRIDLTNQEIKTTLHDALDSAPTDADRDALRNWLEDHESGE